MHYSQLPRRKSIQTRGYSAYKGTLHFVADGSDGDSGIKMLCYAAIADLFKYLPLSKANPQAVDIRQKLQLASMSMMFLSKGLHLLTHLLTG